jgi:hypothetical protein
MRHKDARRFLTTNSGTRTHLYLQTRSADLSLSPIRRGDDENLAVLDTYRHNGALHNLSRPNGPSAPSLPAPAYPSHRRCQSRVRELVRLVPTQISPNPFLHPKPAQNARRQIIAHKKVSRLRMRISSLYPLDIYLLSGLRRRSINDRLSPLDLAVSTLLEKSTKTNLDILKGKKGDRSKKSSIRRSFSMKLLVQITYGVCSFSSTGIFSFEASGSQRRRWRSGT